MVCKGADEALHPETNDCLRDVLVPKALVVTPNLFEAYQLSGVKINSLEDMKEAAKKIHALGAKYVLIKGGSKLGTETAIDVLYDGETFDLLESEKSIQPIHTVQVVHILLQLQQNLQKENLKEEAVKLLKNSSQLLFVTHSKLTNTYIQLTMVHIVNSLYQKNLSNI